MYDMELDVAEYLKLDSRIKELEYEREAIKARLKANIGQDKETNVNNWKVSNKIVCSDTLDVKAIKANVPENVWKPYIKQNITTRFSIKSIC